MCDRVEREREKETSEQRWSNRKEEEEEEREKEEEEAKELQPFKEPLKVNLAALLLALYAGKR